MDTWGVITSENNPYADTIDWGKLKLEITWKNHMLHHSKMCAVHWHRQSHKYPYNDFFLPNSQHKFYDSCKWCPGICGRRQFFKTRQTAAQLSCIINIQFLQLCSKCLSKLFLDKYHQILETLTLVKNTSVVKLNFSGDTSSHGWLSCGLRPTFCLGLCSHKTLRSCCWFVMC